MMRSDQRWVSFNRKATEFIWSVWSLFPHGTISTESKIHIFFSSPKLDKFCLNSLNTKVCYQFWSSRPLSALRFEMKLSTHDTQQVDRQPSEKCKFTLESIINSAFSRTPAATLLGPEANKWIDVTHAAHRGLIFCTF